MPSCSQRVDSLVRSAHRRSLILLGVEQAAFAISVVFAGCVVILIAGTQLLSWHFLLLLAIAGAAVAVFRSRGRIPHPYGTAQTLDHRLRLRDTVSTAWHLSRHPEAAETPAGQFQLQQAESVLDQVDIHAAYPFRIHRPLIAALSLAVVAFALFSVRYLVHHDLNLAKSLVPIPLGQIASVFDGLTAANEPRLAKPADTGNDGKQRDSASRNSGSDPKVNDVVGLKNPSGANSNADSAATPESQFQTAKTAGESNGESGSDQKGKSSATKPVGNNADATEAANGVGRNAQPNDLSPENADQQDKGLLSRMKDAASSLLAKMKPAEASQQSAQSAAQNAAAPDQDQGQAESGASKGQQTSRSQSAQSKSSSQSQGQNTEQGQATEMTQTAQSRTSGRSEQNGGNQAKSGVGKQDGGKDLQSAEELKAMGKLSEIIGKRSQEVSGDMTVEVPSGKQQLKTAFTGEVAQHHDSGGEINRDEIPLAFQQYVKEYMERVHREKPATKQQ